ncbi:transcriptional regulator [Paenibacillus baekrokdamisoli]|uniref:Transcriptional regulator n=1 Tax=Paenibacillus baekrokdamisoli TaxID=1712516 RepID=A0A3G9JCQ0_9BACL|nr:AraC family transcriptional regulator [Paenibacillus baekrokdamisoli]MBB3068234.1 AraC family L-rhamnose operon transcriptional activator RhaR [Paenibacillus baekrokdamisoli]BBH22723.1 transcriptional regulator [Paenibacillus baekrokdamisoli]
MGDLFEVDVKKEHESTSKNLQETAFARGVRLMPFSSLVTESETPIYVNRAHESFDLLMHSHDFIEICLVAEGTGVHYIGSQQIQVARGDMFFIPIGVSHVFRPQSTTKGRTLIIYNCTFREELFHKLLQAVPLEPDMIRSLAELNEQQRWLHFHDHNEEGQYLFRRLHLEFTTRRSGFAASLCASTIELLITVFRSLTPQEPKDNHLSAAWMNELLGYLRSNCAMELHAGQIAAQLGISGRHFQRSFKKQTGMTFLEYIQNARIDQSCQLLLSTTDKITHIAAIVGYHDIKYFNALFKKKTGVTPRQYRTYSGPA